jgi:competence protein ComEC
MEGAVVLAAEREAGNREAREDGAAESAAAERTMAEREGAVRPGGEGGQGAALARALVLADPSGLPERWQRGLRRSGLAHLLAVSGLHVGLVAGIVLLASAFLPWRLRLVLGLVAIAGYLLLAGPRPALLRAALMGGLATVSLLAARVPSGANALAVAAAALVLSRPDLVDDLGFRLTATATAGILFLAPALARRWAGLGADERDPGLDDEGGAGRGGRGGGRSERGALSTKSAARRTPFAAHPLGRLRRLLAPPLAATVAAQLVSLPVAAPAFHLLSWTAPLANLLAVPWTALALALSLAWTAAALVAPPLAAALLPALDLVAAPFGWPSLGPPSWWGTIAVAAPPAVALLVAGSAALWLLAPLRRLPLLAVLLLLLPALRWGGEGPARHPGLEAVFLDVGQGDAILLRDGPRALLVDGGGWPSGDLGGRVLVPALVAEGVGRLDAVLLTHPDRDHCRGLVDVASYLAIGEAWLARGLPREGCAGELAAAVAGQGGEVREVAAGDRRRLGRWRLDVLHPAAAVEGAPAPGASGANDDSIVVLAIAAGRRLLLTGDVEAPAERRLVRARGDLLRADVLKLAHHGSKSSTGGGFLAAVAPRLAIASAGHRNPYGHPADLVRRRLHQRRVPLLRTDHHGMIHLAFPELPAERGPEARPPPLLLEIGRLWPLAQPPPP